MYIVIFGERKLLGFEIYKSFENYLSEISASLF